MATETKSTTQADAWERFSRTVDEQFTGRANVGLRSQIKRTVLKGGSLGLLARTIGLTAFGAAALDACRAAAADWQSFAYGGRD